MKNKFINPEMNINSFADANIVTASDGMSMAEDTLRNAGVSQENITKINIKLTF